MILGYALKSISRDCADADDWADADGFLGAGPDAALAALAALAPAASALALAASALALAAAGASFVVGDARDAYNAGVQIVLAKTIAKATNWVVPFSGRF